MSATVTQLTPLEPASSWPVGGGTNAAAPAAHAARSARGPLAEGAALGASVRARTSPFPRAGSGRHTIRPAGGRGRRTLDEMGRGRGHRQGFGARPRPTAPDGVRARIEGELEGIRSQLPGLCRAEAERILAGSDDLLIAPRRAGGVSGDDKLPAHDLWSAACWLRVAGDEEASLELARRALAHQKSHLARLEDASRRPNSSRNYGFVRSLGRRGIQPAADDARETLDQIEAALAGRPNEELTRYRHWIALTTLCVEPLSRLLVAGDARSARILCRDALQMIGDEREARELAALPDETYLRVGRWLKARQILGEDGAPQDLMADLPRFERHWRDQMASRLAGDDEEALLDDTVAGLGRWSEHRGVYQGEYANLETARTGDEVMLRAGAMLRTPRRYEEAGYRQARPDLAGRLVQVMAEPQAFHEFCEAGEGPAFRGYTLGRRGDSLELAAHMGVCAGRDEIEVRCILQLGETRRRALRPMLEEARAHPDWPVELLGAGEQVTLSSPETNSPISRPHRFPADEPPAPRAGLDELLGDQSCDHRTGRWVAVGGGTQGERVHAPDGIALECPRCLRRRVAVLPLLATPRDDPRLPALDSAPDDAALLRQEHAYRALRGEPDLDDTGLRSLLEELRPDSLDPRLWATRPPDVQTPVRPRESLFAGH